MIAIRLAAAVYSPAEAHLHSPRYAGLVSFEEFYVTISSTAQAKWPIGDARWKDLYNHAFFEHCLDVVDIPATVVWALGTGSLCGKTLHDHSVWLPGRWEP